MSSSVPSHSMRSSLETALQEYEKQLPGSPGEYALLNRGLSEETIRAFRLGYVRDPLTGHDSYWGYISIPYLTKAGPVGMRFKRVSTTGPKVLAHEGSHALPYNVSSLSKQGTLYLCEGEPDTWAATEAGLNALGIPGVDSWNPLWRRLLRNAEKVVMLQQGDTKIPEKMTTTPAKQLTKNIVASGVYLSVIATPANTDVNDLLIERGAAGVREFVGA